MRALLNVTLSALLLLGAAGCSTFMPKKVEIGQDKVQSFPLPSSSELEIHRQAAQRAKEKAREVLITAVKGMSPPEITRPAAETAEITDAVSTVLGPPKSRSGSETEALADRARATVARLAGRVEDFREDNDKNVGKKIEGTGWLQVGYFAWCGGFLILLGIGYIALRVVATLGAAANPVVGLGVNAVSLGARGAAKALQQVLKGGQEFKAAVDQKIESQEVKDYVLELFRTSQDRVQDEDVKQTVRQLKQVKL